MLIFSNGNENLKADIHHFADDPPMVSLMDGLMFLCLELEFAFIVVVILYAK